MQMSEQVTNSQRPQEAVNQIARDLGHLAADRVANAMHSVTQLCPSRDVAAEVLLAGMLAAASVAFGGLSAAAEREKPTMDALKALTEEVAETGLKRSRGQ
jgi:hypothetical protein